MDAGECYCTVGRDDRMMNSGVQWAVPSWVIKSGVMEQSFRIEAREQKKSKDCLFLLVSQEYHSGIQYQL